MLILRLLAVAGILLPQPFKIVRLGPVSLFAHDLAAAEAFYRDVMGFIRTEEVTWEGQRCLFLRANTEHHALALYPIALRATLGLSAHTTSMALGLQIANYRQLRDAVAFLRAHGARVVDLPPGWDGRPRPPAQRRTAPQQDAWPDTLEATSDSYCGEPFMGPWR